MTSISRAVPAMTSSLIPVRIDVVSDDKSIRIVDTLLLDPTCWPIPLYAPLQESLERNVQELAHTILGEAEVQGMGRTVRHFTGRVDLWSPRFQAKIEAQLRPQLLTIVLNDDYLPKAPNNNSNDTQIRIAIRLVVHGVVVHEDILWDPKVPVSPMEFAQDMGNEYNLPEEGVVAIATTILEQIYGLTVDASPDASATPTTNKRTTGAWMMDTKDHVATVAQMVAQHRPA
jgi:hypothetical protein